MSCAQHHDKRGALRPTGEFMAQAHKKRGKHPLKPRGNEYKPKKTYGQGDDRRTTKSGKPITKTGPRNSGTGNGSQGETRR